MTFLRLRGIALPGQKLVFERGGMPTLALHGASDPIAALFMRNREKTKRSSFRGDDEFKSVIDALFSFGRRSLQYHLR